MHTFYFIFYYYLNYALMDLKRRDDVEEVDVKTGDEGFYGGK